MARFSWGQSFRILFKSRLIPEPMIGHFIFNCQSSRTARRARTLRREARELAANRSREAGASVSVETEGRHDSYLLS